MTTTWAERREELLSDCLVSPEVFPPLIDRLGEFVVLYQHALETETDQHHMPLYLVGLLSHLDRKNAGAIATLIDVERLVMQAFIGTASWDHRPLLTVLVGPVAERLGAPDGLIAFDPSSLPQRGTHAVGGKRQWCLIGETHRGQQGTPALPLPQVCYGLRVLRLEVFCPPGIDSSCHQVSRQ